jgi:hypothetical protein
MKNYRMSGERGAGSGEERDDFIAKIKRESYLRSVDP